MNKPSVFLLTVGSVVLGTLLLALLHKSTMHEGTAPRGATIVRCRSGCRAWFPIGGSPQAFESGRKRTGYRKCAEDQ